ncbi:MAG: hypothetical protein UV71_C0001G0104 [Microgenomates group bacterium GW2011_GWC1_43_13]|uniref:Uncharacterized protein n=3 Tax=Candidatus Woeseibacteriota TaxID=1752722 RepID=A0A837IDS3_9BACT|nr:MAG: hypothetical protein UV71_C0001G0104 [Microgenomates group bacterium GW2011_GWC1_43_13]KKT32849.1 MAG: hypothetical protein UW20_C0008G0023 [Candidatus Woesebacteria bacterium GW2011_GWB1_44_11]KKT54645.1 MAG: hypothetical protein UW47_C0004G0052 [Candidatus Woesebacteria bacterium GW2011_GWA1_44_23]OGM76436.1 MAG: hypothetical protein A2208_00085 [Candidatus Woesebacteria bacterium RIFOXYA1_FULL_43_16]OGM81628.1 MAG: hypothetical protein A2394_02310 [Candidatus Woesebacteria bacterium 
MAKLLSDINLFPNSGLEGIGKLGRPGPEPITLFADFISGVVALLTVIAVIWAVFSIITGAISIISSGGDKQALESARKKITNGIIGLVVVIAALFIIEIVAYFLGINGILNIAKLLCKPLGTCP